MPSLAPSCRYGMIEWFHRSMNHGLNSATDTGHDKKKQGPNGAQKKNQNTTLSKFTSPELTTSWDCHLSHLWESLTCCTSPGTCGDGTKAAAPSQASEGEPGAPNLAPSLGGPPPLYDASTSAGTHLLVPHCWRRSTSCDNIKLRLSKKPSRSLALFSVQTRREASVNTSGFVVLTWSWGAVRG